MTRSSRPRRVPELLVGLLAVAVAVVVTAFVVAGAIKAVKVRRDTIAVTGSARYPITSNLATWRIGASSVAVDPAAAARELARESGVVRHFLAAGGLSAGDVGVPPIQTSVVSVPVPGHPKQRRVAYRLTQSFTVSSSKVSTVEKVAAGVGALYEQGVPVSVSGIHYVSTRLSQARRKALERATADAKKRADTIVKGIGGNLGGIRKASLGVYQIVPRNSTAISDYGINDTSARDKDVIAVVTLTFGVA
jgi:hypothetical protein